MAKKRICILGGGISGLSAAWHLKNKNVDCLLFEKEKEIGGLCRSKNVGGFTFDYDGHLLHFKNSYAFNLIKELMGGNLVMHERSAWIYSCGVYSRYPYQANLHGLPGKIVKECLLGFINAAQKNPYNDKKRKTFLDWINQTFGKGIAKHFMIPYNTKFWTTAPENMTCDWLYGFIPIPSLTQLVEGTVQESRRQLGYNASFCYPKKGGISQVPLAFYNQLKNVYTDCRATEIDLRNKKIRFECGRQEKFDSLIYTLALPEIPRLVRNLPSQAAALFKRLKWNSVFNLNLGVANKDFSGRHWIYFPQKELSFFRVGFPHNFSSSLTPSGHSSIYAEVSYSREKPIRKKTIVSRIIRELKKVGILEDSNKICVQDINDIKYGYPIYDMSYDITRAKIARYLAGCNITLCGRYGSWRYFSMEDSVIDGRRAAEDILSS